MSHFVEFRVIGEVLLQAVRTNLTNCNSVIVVCVILVLFYCLVTCFAENIMRIMVIRIKNNLSTLGSDLIKGSSPKDAKRLNAKN